MGQLRSAIEALAKKINVMDPEVKGLETIVLDAKERVYGISRTADEGYNALYLYIMNIYKNNGTTPEAHSGDALGTIADGELKKLVKGTADWNANIKKRVAEVNSDCDTAASKLLSLNSAATEEAAKLVKIAEKKKAKLLKSKSYKEKIKTYLSALDSLVGILNVQAQAVNGAKGVKFKDTWVNDGFPIVALTWTVQQVKDRTTMDFNNTLTQYENDRGRYENHVRKFRDEFKTIPNQLKMMKKWTEEADAMEKESEEK